MDYRLIEPGQFGLQRIGHSGFFRTQARDALWPLVDGWMEPAQQPAERLPINERISFG